MKTFLAAYSLDQEAYGLIYGPEEREAISRLVTIADVPQPILQPLELPFLLSKVNVLISGWGGPRLDRAFLDAAPNLKLVLYGAGSTSSVMTQSAWDRGIAVTSAYAANAIPVAEYSLATILFSLKHGWELARMTKELRRFPRRDGAPGCFGRTVGLVSLGVIARKLLDLLKNFDLSVIAYDPYVSPDEARRLGVRMVSLSELFKNSDVISLHTPQLTETEGLITGALLSSMRTGATFINTARGPIVRENELITTAIHRPDLQFILDVARKEPPDTDSPLYVLPNVVMTPHIAGSVGQECRRMGQYMVEELNRFVSGKPLKWLVTPEMAARSSHRPQSQNVEVRIWPLSAPSTATKY